MTYQTLTRSVTARLDIKKSQFIAYAYPVDSRDHAMFHVEHLRAKYIDARHHCWAYIIGNPSNTTSAGFDDDGEPSGTAGKPILNVLQHKDIGNIIIIVVRYFGGVKLGAGGLTRAYASAAQAVIDTAKDANLIVPYVPMTHVLITTDFANESQVRYVVEDIGGQMDTVNYTQNVTMVVTIAEKDLTELTERLTLYAKIVPQ